MGRDRSGPKLTDPEDCITSTEYFILHRAEYIRGFAWCRQKIDKEPTEKSLSLEYRSDMIIQAENKQWTWDKSDRFQFKKKDCHNYKK